MGMRSSGGDLKIMNYLDADQAMGYIAKADRSKRSSLAGGKKRVARKQGWGTDFLVGKVDDFSGSDTEKQGVAILGCRFSEKVENVPIKKRRSLVLSPQLQFGVVDLSLNGKLQSRTLDALSTTKLSVEVLRERGDYDTSQDSEGFSGIEILADVACNNVLINSCDDGDGGNHNEEAPLVLESTPEGVDSLVRAVPLEEIGHLSPEDKPEALTCPSSTATVLQKSEDLTDNNRVVEEYVSSGSHRLHWDLNVTMDAWEQPYGTSDADQEANLAECISTMSKNMLILDGCKSHEESKVLTDNSVSVFHSICAVGGGNTHESKEKPEDNRDNSSSAGYFPGHCNSNSEETEDKVLRGHDRNSNKCVPSTSSNVQEVSNIVVQTVSVDIHEDPAISSHVQSENVSSGNSLKVEACDVSACDKESDRDLSVMREIHPYISQKEASTVHKDVKSMQVTGNPDRHGFECEVLANNFGDCDHSPSTRFIPVEGVSSVDIKCKSEEEKLAVIGSSAVDIGFNTLIQKSSIGATERVNLTTEDDNSNESYASDVYQADKVDMVGADEVHTGYSSQFEDGELRESRSWDENGEDGEVEHLGYRSDCEEEEQIRFCDGRLDNNNEKKLTVGSGSRENLMRKTTHESGNGPMRSGKDYNSSGFSRLRELERQLSSRIERADGLYSKEVGMRNRGDIYCKFHSQDERESCSRRYIARDRASSYSVRGSSPRERNHQHNFNSSSGYLDLDCNYSATCHGAYAHRMKGGLLETRSTNVAGNNRQESAFQSSFYQRINRRRSPSDRDEAYRWSNIGQLHSRENTSPTRNRFRRFQLQSNRGCGVREEYQRRVPDNELGFSNHVSHRERSVSPNRGRLHHISTYKKSWSRSRSRSPVAYIPTKERNRGSRHRSRSPDFSRDDRIIDRARLQFQKRFTPEREEGFVSSARGDWISLQRNSGSRWFDERNDYSEDFRTRKQQSKGVFRSQMLDSGYSIRRFDSDEKFRPQSRKFRQEEELRS